MNDNVGATPGTFRFDRAMDGAEKFFQLETSQRRRRPTLTACPPYERTEVERSRSHRGHLDADVIAHARGTLVADFGVDWRTPKSSLRRDSALRSWIDTLIRTVRANPSTTIRVIGYSDCGGGEHNNYLLRRGRAERVLVLLQALAGPSWPLLRSRTTAAAAPAGEYVADNSTVEGRAKNRGVLIEHVRDLPMEPEKITARPATGQCRFLPSVHGFRFPNSFTLPSRLISLLKRLGISAGSGAGTYGLCGGMAFLAADHFVFGVPRPAVSNAPPIGSSLYIQLVMRLLDSWQIKFRMLGSGPFAYPSPAPDFAAPVWKFWAWMGLPDRGPGSTAERSTAELPAINSALARGSFVVLGLVLVDRSGSLDDNHQVLVYCMRQTAFDRYVYAVYDPNHELRDDIRIEVQLVGRETRITQVVPLGSHQPPARAPIRGIFKMPYVPKRP